MVASTRLRHPGLKQLISFVDLKHPWIKKNIDIRFHGYNSEVKLCLKLYFGVKLTDVWSCQRGCFRHPDIHDSCKQCFLIDLKLLEKHSNCFRWGGNELLMLAPLPWRSIFQEAWVSRLGFASPIRVSWKARLTLLRTWEFRHENCSTRTLSKLRQRCLDGFQMETLNYIDLKSQQTKTILMCQQWENYVSVNISCWRTLLCILWGSTRLASSAGLSLPVVQCNNRVQWL